MNQQEAEKLLTDTFNRDFNQDKYVHFLKELLKGKLSINPKSSSPPKQFEEYIKSFRKIGEYKNGRNTLEVLIVELKKTSSLERARTMQRNFIAKWLNSDYSPKDGALVAFYEENLEDWRFSFVKMDYKFGEDGKVIKELTPAKRYSFLVGKNEPNHTCKKQFLSLLKEETIPPTLEELEKAFSVDNVTKEFFDQYKERFIQLREAMDEILQKNPTVKKEFESHNLNAIEFSKKLLGQIVFLYFLQKKGWLGVQKDSGGKFYEWGSGPKDFMKKLFYKEIVPYNNFFNDILEPLFYQALANDRSADNDYYEKLKCKVPFLNGGLFEPIKDYDWTKIDILIDNNIFRDIFTTFDQFNFTIKEDEPLEKEVAVDPEMLGKVFENLLDVNDRKSKGAFYTPREIVHYMCQQSLINYLETNMKKLETKREEIELFILKGDIALDRLRRIHLGKSDDLKLVLPKSIVKNFREFDRLLVEIKICDPAVGSGAFPVGMMNEIVRARNILTYFFPDNEKKERTDYDLKRQTIENSLYGVDLESSAVEITKLRFWLSLIVDELDMKNIRPLPNLDNKIMCGNSLVEEFGGVKLFSESLINGNGNGKISKQTTLFKKESDYKLDTLQRLQSEYFNEQDRNKKRKLMDEIEKIEWEFIETTLKEKGNDEAMKKLEQCKNSKSKPFFLWKLYFSDVFKRDNPGFDIVIANPPYVPITTFSKEVKDLLLRNNPELSGTFSGKIDLYAFFILLSFKKLLRKNGNLNYIIPKTILSNISFTELRRYITETFEINEITDLEKIFEQVTGTMTYLLLSVLNTKADSSYPVNINIMNFGGAVQKSKIDIRLLKSPPNYIWVLSKKKLELIRKLERDSDPLSENFITKNGVCTGSNSKFVSDKKENSYYRKIRVAKDISKYHIKKSTNYVCYKREVLHRPREEEIFIAPKIITQMIRGLNTKDRLICALDPTNELVLNNVNLIRARNKSANLKFLLAIINSEVINFYFKTLVTDVNIKTIYLDQIPIRKIPSEKQKPFIELVDRILSITDDEDYLNNGDKQAMVKALEKRIDKLVYELYDLTPEEIKVVEGLDKEK